MMLGLSHYAFRQKLLQRAEEKKNHIIIIDEAYTSKTCGRCGNIKKNLNGSKTYKCKKCDLEIDRDINGARNIMLSATTINKKENDLTVSSRKE